ncbi:hypothetical protein WR25_25064 [Diploscapter pachys]|uniref:ATP-dependent DNA helicase n=1 Tax=Diploscapter pachys TaxID=2018661 RepID=A0A2A2KQD8_9BILA|nr:hypothetical protein WR25_25064 [Diploscapter pachys]
MPYCYKVQGQLYHTMNLAMHPDPNEKPDYAQLFFIDSVEALNLRMAKKPNVNCNRSLMEKIDVVLREVNRYYQSYKHMKEIEDEVEAEARRRGEAAPELRLIFDVSGQVDKRRYNIPRANEIAAVFVLNDKDEMPYPDKLAVHQRGRQLRTITKFDKTAESMLYPLYFPTSKGGCYAGMRIDDEKVTFMQYYQYMTSIRRSSLLMDREEIEAEHACCFAEMKWNSDPNEVNDFNPIRLGGKLYQQYLVDAYVKIEQDRLDYIRENQKALKVESYKALRDYLEDTADAQGKNVGRTIILPSSFKGSPRNCQQAYQDSMAMVRRYGKPHMFVTFTCNPKWSEITRNLMPGNTVLDEPDLVDRVFNQKLDELMDDLTKKQYFGKAIAYTYVVEFQKRGLPHAHILLILDRSDDIRADEIDSIVCAEIPDKKKYPRLHEIIASHMLHGPCGIHNLNCPCMTDDKKGNKICSKKYPKEFRETTHVGRNSYPEYRRRDNGEYVERKGIKIDNRWVVPFSPVLSLKFDAHVNVEICASIKSVKYLYKYVYKGHDCARMAIQVQNGGIVYDELTKYVNMRYVTPHEGYWRIAEFKLDERSHSVMRLAVHLPNEQLIYYKPQNDDIGQRLNDSELRNTTLTGWFDLNERDADARNYYYFEIPEYYTFKKSRDDGNMIWDRRTRSFNVIGRMYVIHPKQKELFYLRMILLHKKGAKSWEDLLTTEDYDGDANPKETFREAARAMGLLSDDIVWETYFDEMKDHATAFQMRELFVSIITHGENVNVKRVWERFGEYMADDFARNYDDEVALRRALVEIEKMLESAGDSLENYEMDKPNTGEFDDEIPWDEDEEMEKGRQMRASMNTAQESIVAYVLNKAEKLKNGENVTNGYVYIDGPGGSGKTYTYKTICYLLRGMGIKYKTCAWMGIAANLIPDGRTMHKTFGLPFEMDSQASSNAKSNNKIGRELVETQVFIVDEISMVPKFALEIIDRKLKELMDNDLIFGGKVFIIGGDFRQILPVKKKAGRNELVNLSVVQSKLWKNFRVFRLKENRRVIQNTDDDRTNVPVREDFAGLDLEEYVFSHGMAYVAFSRVRAWDFLKVKVSNKQYGKVKNLVWKEVLLPEEEVEEQSQRSERASRRSTQNSQGESQGSQEL